MLVGYGTVDYPKIWDTRALFILATVCSNSLIATDVSLLSGCMLVATKVGGSPTQSC